MPVTFHLLQSPSHTFPRPESLPVLQLLIASLLSPLLLSPPSLFPSLTGPGVALAAPASCPRTPRVSPEPPTSCPRTPHVPPAPLPPVPGHPVFLQHPHLLPQDTYTCCALSSLWISLLHMPMASTLAPSIFLKSHLLNKTVPKDTLKLRCSFSFSTSWEFLSTSSSKMLPTGHRAVFTLCMCLFIFAC